MGMQADRAMPPGLSRRLRPGPLKIRTEDFVTPAGASWFWPTVLASASCSVAARLLLAAVRRAPGASSHRQRRRPSATPPPAAIPLAPAKSPDDPFAFVAWLFTPIFQAFFILLVFLDQLTGNIAIAIILLTLVVRAIMIPFFRRQTVSTKRMQMLAPGAQGDPEAVQGRPMKLQHGAAASSTASAASTRSPAACPRSSSCCC